MRTGRPTVLTPAKIKQIAQCFFDGFTDEETGLLCGIDRKTIYRARAGGFCPAIKIAELQKKAFYLEKIRNGNNGNWQGLAWFMERRWPTQLAKPEIQLSFNSSYTQNNLSINISASDAKQIEKDASPIRSKIEGMFKAYRPELGNGNGHETKDDASI